MPSVTLSDKSVLLSAGGWRIVNSLASSCEIAFVDRHGKLTQAAATLVPTAKKAQLAYIGTQAAFAAVTTDTRILASTGKRWMAKDLVGLGDISQVAFETLFRIPESFSLRPNINEVWQSLVSVAAFENKEMVALRSHVRHTATLVHSEAIEFITTGDTNYALIKRKQLEAALTDNWTRTIIELISGCMTNRNENRVEIERAAYYLALWFAAALVRSKSAFVFHFDTLQHSSYVFVSGANELPQPIQRGGCAFFVPDDTRETILTWTDRSLAPVVGGFLIGNA